MKYKFLLLMILGLSTIAFRPLYGSEERQASDTIMLVLQAENTSSVARKVPVRYGLPKEILPEYINEPEEFSIDYNSEEDRFYLAADIAFNPYEVKTFYVSVKNIWFIPEPDIGRYISSARSLYERIILGHNDDIKDEARSIFSFITQEASRISQSQAEDQAVSAHIASFRKNTQRLDDIKNNIERLRKLSTEIKTKENKPSFASQNKDMIEMIILMIIVFILLFTIISCHLWITRFKKDKKIPSNKN